MKVMRTAPVRTVMRSGAMARPTWPSVMSGLIFYIIALYVPMLLILATMSGIPLGRAVWCVLGFAVGAWAALAIGDRIVRRWSRREASP